jgi:hypothetical protein
MIGRKCVLKGWTNIAKNKDSWKLILKEAMVLHGAQGQ